MISDLSQLKFAELSEEERETNWLLWLWHNTIA